MPKSAATKAALQWLQTGKAPNDRSLEVALCMALLSGEVPLSPAVFTGREIGRDVLLATIVAADDSQMWGLVQLLRDHGTDKTCKKLAKKVLFRAQQRGQIKPEESPDRSAVDLSARADPPPSYCTSFDRSGAQVVLFGGATDLDGAFGLVGVVNLRKGLETVSFFARPSRKRMRQLAQDLSRRFGGLVVEVEMEFAAGRLSQALAIADQRRAPIDGDIGVGRRLLAGIAPAEGKLTQIDAAISAAEPTEFSDLVQLDCMVQWCSAIRADARAGLNHAEPADGLRGQTDALNAWAIAAADSAIASAVTRSRRIHVADQLQVTAGLLARANRSGDAHSAMLAAADCLDEQVDAVKSPFIRALVQFDKLVEQASEIANFRVGANDSSGAPRL